MITEETGAAPPEQGSPQEMGTPVRARWAIALPIIAAVALAAVAPMMWLGFPDGHDFSFHAPMWIDTVEQWRGGTPYTQWAHSANYGFGEPRFVFYPPLARMLNAFALLLLPEDAAPAAYCFLVLVLAGSSMFALARRWLPPAHAVVAAASYAVGPYLLLCVYQRTAFAELLADALFPLLLAFALELPEGNRAIAPLALGFGGIWLSDLPAAVVVTYSFTLIVVLLAALHRSPGLLARGAAAMALGFALVGFYLVPAAWEQGWVNIGDAISTDFRPEGWHYTFTWDAAAHWFYLTLSCVVFAEIALAALAVVCSGEWRKLHRATGWTVASLAGVCALMMLPVSGAVYQHLPKLEFVQFPWRWLLVMGPCVTLLIAASMARFRAYWLALVMLSISLIAGLAAGCSTPWHYHLVREYRMQILDNGGYEGSGQFMPVEADAEALAELRETPSATAADPEVIVRIDAWEPERKTIAVRSPAPTTVVLHLMNYPAWRAWVNGRPCAIATDAAGRVVIAVPAGISHVEVEFTRTPDREYGLALSALAAAIVAGLFLLRRRSAPAIESPRQ